jgi:hypothetical protein
MLAKDNKIAGVDKLAAIVIACCLAAMWLRSTLAQDAPLPKDRRDLFEQILRDKLVETLEPLQVQGGESKSEEIRVKNDFPRIDIKVGQIDYKVSASAQFPDPARNLRLKIESLLKHDAKTLRGRLNLSTPAEGHLEAELGPIKAKTDFHATAVIESVDIEVVWTVEPNGTLICKPKVTALKTSVRDVKFGGDLAKVFGAINDVAERAANSWLAQNEGKLRDKINAAVEKSFRDGGLRVVREDLVKGR